MPRAWVWVQVLAGWLPVWALYAALVVAAHGTGVGEAALLAARAVAPAALLGFVVHRFTRRVPWPRRFHVGFVLVHLGAAAVYSLSWFVLASVVETVSHGGNGLGLRAPIVPFLVLGVWLYAIVAGISYAIEGTARAARAETAAARTQLAALRAQLHPHFLFNALHTVVQLIPTQPGLAADAAEQVAALLRTTVEEDRDVVSLADEWAFVSRYLDVERLRFGDRLRVHAEIDDDVRDVPVPSFALQTLVENAVRHGAAPQVAPTEITVTARGMTSVASKPPAGPLSSARRDASP